MKKLLSIILAVAMVAVLLAGCGGSAASGNAKTVGVYLSPAELSYSNMRPQYNYYLTTFTQQEITLLDDNTYVAIVSASTFAALELAESTNDAKGNERTNSIVKFYGTYTSQVNDLDEDLLDVVLSAPTRVVESYDQTYWLDTDNWNDDMGKKVVPPTGVDQNTGAPIYDPDAQPWTAAQFLESLSFTGASIQVNQKTASFDYTPELSA